MEKFVVYLKVRQKETENKTFTSNYVARDNSEQEDDKMVNLMKLWQLKQLLMRVS